MVCLDKKCTPAYYGSLDLPQRFGRKATNIRIQHPMSNTNDDSAKKSAATTPFEVESRLYEEWLKAGYFHGQGGFGKGSRIRW
jgi:hypothetical protein